MELPVAFIVPIFFYISLKSAIENIQQPNVTLHIHKPMVYKFTYCIPHLYWSELIKGCIYDK